MNEKLNLNRITAIEYLKRLAKALPVTNNRQIKTHLTKNADIGNATIDNFAKRASKIQLGIEHISEETRFPLAKVSDLSFTRTIVALYHEYGHYLQNYGPEKDMPSMISEVSVIKNEKYYKHAWSELPHEINAEATGVILAWRAMENAFPDHANECMLDYINYRTQNTTYMIPAKQNGYESKNEIMTAFNKAIHKSIYEPRTPQGRFLRYEDESIQLLTQGYENYLRSPNAYHADKLIDTMPGAQKDRMLAALVLQLHPDILEERPLLKSENLTVEHEFGRQLKVKTLPGQHASRQIDDELAHAFETYGSTTNDYANDFDFKT